MKEYPPNFPTDFVTLPIIEPDSITIPPPKVSLTSEMTKPAHPKVPLTQARNLTNETNFSALNRIPSSVYSTESALPLRVQICRRESAVQPGKRSQGKEKAVFARKSRSFLSLDEADFENPAINLQDALCSGFFFCSRGGEFMLLFIPIPGKSNLRLLRY